jgi:hypothetical protein
MFFNTYISGSPKNTELFFLSSEASAPSGHMNGASTAHSILNKMMNKYYAKALPHIFFLKGPSGQIRSASEWW